MKKAFFTSIDLINILKIWLVITWKEKQLEKHSRNKKQKVYL